MELTVGAVLEGKVKSITNFGAFVALPENKTGMVHISEVANAYVSDIHQHLTEGQDVKVMVIGLENGKINLSIKRLEPKPQRENGPRNDFRSGSSAGPRREVNSFNHPLFLLLNYASKRCAIFYYSNQVTKLVIFFIH